jgi:hypothetical protein
VVKPVFTFPLTTRRPQTSWRNWGGIETPTDVDQEASRIREQLVRLERTADFPVRFLPLAVVRRATELAQAADVAGADAILAYAAGDGAGDLMASINPIHALGKPTIFFVRHKSGPLYYWYEGIMARYLHQHTDELAVPGIDYTDVVVDSADELLWRLRALCGWANTVGSRIVAIGGPTGWATPTAPDVARQKWRLDIRSVSYAELGERIKRARSDAAAVAAARQRAAQYLADRSVQRETAPPFIENCFLLETVLRAVMAEADARAITINECMTTIMPLAETTACLTLSVLNDAGYLAFCEADFVVVPAGLLLANISGRPVFLNDPTYPHAGVITLAHCTAPRRMDGVALEPARILTHFESDYGAAPKVEMRRGQKVTNIIPDFQSARWCGFVGEIVDAPFLQICRSQIDVAYRCSDLHLATKMPGFHWITCYGDYAREVAYALRRTPIAWENLG